MSASRAGAEPEGAGPEERGLAEEPKRHANSTWSATRDSGDVGTAAGGDVFVLLVTVPVRQGCEAEYLALVDAVCDAMRHEPTFVNTIVHRSADDPALFMLYETWRDRDDFFRVQRNRPYRAEYEARLPGLLRAPRTMQIFDVLRADYTEGPMS